MNPIMINGATNIFKAPANWDAEKHGECDALAVRVDQGVYQSAWKPTEEEVAALKAGGHVVISIVGSQPPFVLSVAPAEEAAEAFPAVPGATIRNEMMKAVTGLIDHWTAHPVDVRARCQGLAYSILSLIDGRMPAIPALKLVTNRGQVVNEDVTLADLVWEFDEKING